MIQDITPHHLYNEFTPRSPQNGDLIFAFRDRKLLADLSANTCRFPLWENVSSQFPTTASLIWLFALDQTSCFLVMDADLDLPETYTFHSLQEIRGREPKHHIFAAMTAFHLYDWYRNNRFADVAELLLFRILPIKNGCSPAHNVEIPFIRKSVRLLLSE